MKNIPTSLGYGAALNASLQVKFTACVFPTGLLHSDCIVSFYETDLPMFMWTLWTLLIGTLIFQVKLHYLALQKVLVLIPITFDVEKQEGHPVAKSGTLRLATNARLIEAFANACG